MVRRILVPIDGSPQSDAALEYALETFPDAEITALHALDPLGHFSEQAAFPDHVGDWYTEMERNAESLFEEARELAADRGGELRTATETGEAARTIVDYADDHDVDQIVVGSHGRDGLSRVLLGSVAEMVARRSPVPVTVVR